MGVEPEILGCIRKILPGHVQIKGQAGMMLAASGIGNGLPGGGHRLSSCHLPLGNVFLHLVVKNPLLGGIRAITLPQLPGRIALIFRVLNHGNQGLHSLPHSLRIVIRIGEQIPGQVLHPHQIRRDEILPHGVLLVHQQGHAAIQGIHRRGRGGDNHLPGVVRIEHGQGLLPGHAVRVQIMLLLEQGHGAFGAAAILAVDLAGIEPQLLEPLL